MKVVTTLTLSENGIGVTSVMCENERSTIWSSTRVNSLNSGPEARISTSMNSGFRSASMLT